MQAIVNARAPICIWLMPISIGKQVPSLRQPNVSADSAGISLASSRLHFAWAAFRELIMMAGGDEQRERLSDDLLLAVAEQLARRPVERFDQSALAGGHDPVGNVLKHSSGTDLARAQRRAELGDRLQRLLELLGLDEQVDERRTLARRTSGRIGVKMKSTAPLAYAVAISASSPPNAVTKTIGVRSDCSR